MANTSSLSEADRELFGKFADFLVPAYKKMPSASAVGVHKAILDDVLRFRPDLVENFHRGLSQIKADDINGSINSLFKDDPTAFGALSLAVSGGYYMSPEVRSALGYPGQESLTYDPYEVPDFMIDGLLERVVKRGPTYKPTPKS